MRPTDEVSYLAGLDGADRDLENERHSEISEGRNPQARSQASERNLDPVSASSEEVG